MKTNSMGIGAGLLAAGCMTFAACSSTSSNDSDGGISLPPGNSSLVGCVTTAAGCYTAGNASYPTPKVSASCSPPGGVVSGPADMHCKGVTPQTVSPSACSVATMDAGPQMEAGSADSGPPPGLCGENGPDYGATMYGDEGDDDDCKYHVTYTTTPACENDGTYFI